jgi:PKD repeat protein
MALRAVFVVFCLLGTSTPLTLSPAPVAAAGTEAPADPFLDGADAVEALGSDLAEVAAEHDMSAAELTAELLEDDSLKVDTQDRLVFEDSDLELAPLSAPEALAQAEALDSSWTYAGQDYTASDAFALHSRPNSPVRIYLDFTGHTTTGTAWNSSYGATIVSRGLDFDGVSSTYSTAERAYIAKVWSGVAEDFAPFDVDVTTQEPTLEDLRKTSDSDTRFGVRMVMTPDAFRQAGGVAYLGSFSWNTDTPAFCFCTNYSYADATLVVSHEAGHTFGLNHDGTSSLGYYSGHGSWGPIMGAPYGKPIQQWSIGEYSGANNKEDDVAKISVLAPYITDDYTDAMSAAVTMQALETRGLISTAADKDWFKFSFTGGPLAINVKPAFNGNLDAAVELWTNGSLYQRIDTAGLELTSTVADLPVGEYYLSIDGAGYAAATTTGYSDYGSIGEYLLTLTGNASFDPPATIAVTPAVSAAVQGQQVSFSVTSSSHPTLAGLTFAWSFSTGSTATGSTATATMGSTTLTATVTATTANGGVSSASTTVRLSKAPTILAALTPTTAYAGANVVFSATGSDPDAQAMTYEWSFSDGTSATGRSATKTRSTVGTLTGTVTVTDADGNTASASKTATFVTNLPPTVTVSVSKTNVPAPSEVAFSALGADTERTTVTYLWSFPDGSSASTARVLKTFSQAGTYTASVKVTDGHGFSTTKEISTVITSNNAPTVSAASVSATTKPSPAILTFSTTASDLDRQVLTYSWSFTDGRTATGSRPTVTFTTPGSYTATVTATDPGGLTATKSVAFTVTPNRAPAVSIKNISAITQASPAAYSLAAFGTDADNQTLRYSWSFSDGTSYTTASISKKVTAVGSITGTVTVTDPGNLTATASVTLTTTENRAPAISVTYTGSLDKAAPASYTLTAVGSDPDLQRLTYKWTFPDGTTSTSTSVMKRYTTAGTYVLTVTVTDPGGLTATKPVTLTVLANTAPVIAAASVSPASAAVGVSRTFAVSASDQAGQVLAYKWVFHDGTISTSASVAKVFRTIGSYQATVTVTDPGGMVSTQTVSYTVT